MNHELMNELVENLKNRVDQTRATIQVTVNEHGGFIEVGPKVKSSLERPFAELKIRVADDNLIYLKLGEGNYFDVPIEKSTFHIKYISDIAEACVKGEIHETVLRKSQSVVKSVVLITLNGRKEKFNYRKGLFIIGGNKQEIDYMPYPLR